jgi:enoyl-CoA hydratase/carnithine racemase
MANDRIEIDTGTGELLCEIRDRVALITLNRPEARNALSDHLTPARRLMIKQCGDDPAVLLAMAVNRAYQSAGWAWAKLLSGVKYVLDVGIY